MGHGSLTSRRAAPFLPVIMLGFLLLGGCIPALTAEDIAAARVEVWNPDSQSTVTYQIDRSDPAQVQELLDAWASLDSSPHLDYGIISPLRDVVLIVDFKDGRHVEVRWTRSWSQRQADYLERSQSGANVIPENNVGMRSEQMVAYLKGWMAQTGLEPPLPVTQGPPEGWVTVGLGGGQPIRDHPQVDGNYAVWSAWDGSDLELFVFDIAAGLTTQLTNNNTDDHDVCLADGQVTWLVDTLLPPPQPLVDHEDVCFCDLASGRTVQVTEDETRKRPPQTSEGRVLWQATKSPDTTPAPWPYDVLLCEPDSGEVKVLASDVPREEIVSGLDDPCIAGDLVVWVAPTADGADTEVFLYRISDGTTTQLTDDANKTSDARVGEEAVAWLEGYSQVMVLDLTSGETRTFASSSEQPLLTFDGRTFILRTSKPGGEVYALAFDLDTGMEVALPPSLTAYDDGLAVGVLTAEDGAQQIWLFDATTRTQINLSGRPDRYCVLPSISEGQVVWIATQSGDQGAAEMHLSLPRATTDGD